MIHLIITETTSSFKLAYNIYFVKQIYMNFLILAKVLIDKFKEKLQYKTKFSIQESQNYN